MHKIIEEVPRKNEEKERTHELYDDKQSSSRFQMLIINLRENMKSNFHIILLGDLCELGIAMGGISGLKFSHATVGFFLVPLFAI